MPLTRSRERLLRRISTRRGREAEGVVLLEGPRVLATAWEQGAELLFAVVQAGPRDPAARSLADRIAGAGVDLHEVAAEAFGGLATTENPQGILAVAREPVSPLDLPSGGASALVLDGIQDPGNVGTLVRTAAALAVDRVLALDGTADAWGAKAVRASAGLVFRIPPSRVTWERARRWLEEARVPLIVADPRGTDLRMWLRAREARNTSARSDVASRWALLLGNEGAGPRREALDAASARLAIPLPAGVESMNVAMAGAILLWALGPGREETSEAER